MVRILALLTSTGVNCPWQAIKPILLFESKNGAYPSGTPSYEFKLAAIFCHQVAAWVSDMQAVFSENPQNS
jgi:hypothetical protein